MENSPYTFSYLTSGNSKNQAILFLHGFLGNKNDWQKIINTLSKIFYCVAVDLPGHGETATQDNDINYSMQKCAQGIVDFFEKLKIIKPHLLGYSMGGRLAWFLAVYYPDKWNKVIIESATPGIENEIEKRERLNYDFQFAHRLENENLELFLCEWYKQPVFASLNKKKIEELISLRLNNNPKNLAKALRFMSVGLQPDLWKKLNYIKSEILYICGENDKKYRNIAQKMLDCKNSINLKILENCGHNCHFEQPQKFSETVKDFLVEKNNFLFEKDLF